MLQNCKLHSCMLHGCKLQKCYISLFKITGLWILPLNLVKL